jgi:hypothetical protein
MDKIQDVIDKVFETLVKEYNYDKDVLYKVFNSVYTTTTSPTPTPTPPPTVDKCLYMYKRGKMQDKTCDAPVNPGMVVCKTHIKFNEKYKVLKPTAVKKKKDNVVIKNSVVYNNCKTPEDDAECHNLDEMQVPDINKLYQDIFKTSHVITTNTDKPDTYKFELLSEEIFLEKKKAIITYCLEKDIKVKATLTKLGQLDFNTSNLITVRHPKGAILKFVKYKLSKYWIDYTTRLIFKSPEELMVIGRINRYEQPLLAIDGTAFDLILKFQFDYDETLLNENGKQAKDAFDASCARYKQMKAAELLMAEPAMQGNNVVL